MTTPLTARSRRRRLHGSRIPPICALVTLLLTGAGAEGQPVPESALVDRVFQEWNHAGSPGCAVGVYHRGELAFSRGYGEANLDWGIPIDDRTVFYSGSVSKQFTAAVAALLHLEGTLDLDSDVRSLIPELPDYGSPVTIRHLVHHTSGVRDIYGLISLSAGRVADAWTDQEYLELIAAQRELNFPPGSAYLYSNGGYYLLTTSIERASGKRLDEVARELVFGPLGMDDTHFHQESTRLVPRRAMSYAGSRESGFRQTYLGNFDKSGAGGLYTTIRDLAAWDRNFETGEVGGQAFLDLIQTPGVITSGEDLTYAFGLALGEVDGRRTVGHGGSFMGFRADFVRYPDQGVSAAALCNLGSIDPSPLTRRVVREALDGPSAAGAAVEAEAPGSAATGQGRAPTHSPPPPSLPLRDYAGTYASDEVGSSIQLRWTGSALQALVPGTGEFRDMDWSGGDRFRAGGLVLDVLVEGARPTGLRLDAGRVRNLLFVREEG
jgi:CubicO group peptidase (beta-lactamase class C family)